MRKLVIPALVLGLGLLIYGCGGNPTSPTTPTPKAVVTGTLTVTAQDNRQGGIDYYAEVTLKETGGVSATINNSVAVQLLKNGAPYTSAELVNNAWPLYPSSNTLPAHGSLHSNPLFMSVKPDGVATQVDARIDFVDVRQNGGTLHITGDVPATVGAAPSVVIVPRR